MGAVCCATPNAEFDHYTPQRFKFSPINLQASLLFENEFNMPEVGPNYSFDEDVPSNGQVRIVMVGDVYTGKKSAIEKYFALPSNFDFN